MISGVLSLGGDLYDVTNSKKIYDSATGKFDPSVMPYEKGDLVSDWATNTISDYYYMAMQPEDVSCGVAFGRNQIGVGGCGACYDCDGTSCVAQTVDGAAATALGCTAGSEACRRCNNGSCTYYSDYLQHGCATNYICNSSGACQFQASSDYCSTHNGVVTNGDGSKIFCSGGKMWSTTLASGYNWDGAKSACSYLTYAGFSDWYLPNKDTLGALWGTDTNHLDCGATNCTSWDPHCCSSSAGIAYNYWSSTGSSSGEAYFVEFNVGAVNDIDTVRTQSVRCVRP